MRKIVLRMNIDFKYSVIKKLVDPKGKKKHTAIQFNCSIRTKLNLPVWILVKNIFNHNTFVLLPPYLSNDSSRRQSITAIILPQPMPV